MFYAVKLHLQSGEQSRFAVPHLHLEPSPLQEHLISSLRDDENELSSKLEPMTVIPSPVETDSQAVLVRCSSKFLLDTLRVGQAAAEHPWCVVVCPLLDF